MSNIFSDLKAAFDSAPRDVIASEFPNEEEGPFKNSVASNDCPSQKPDKD